MNFNYTLLSFFAFFFPLWAFGQASNGVFMVVKGEVKVTTSDGKIQPAKVGQKVNSGDTIEAGKESRAKVVMSDKNTLNISPESKVQIEKYVFNEATNEKQVSLNVLFGKMRASVEQKYDGEKNTFQVKTPSAVAGVRGTDFLTQFDPGKRQAKIVTFEGAVAVGQPGPGGKILNPVIVRPGEFTTANAGASPQPPASVPKEELAQMNKESTADAPKAGPEEKGKKEDKKEEKKEEKKDEASKDEKKDDKKDDAKKDEKKDEVAKDEKKEEKKDEKKEEAKKDEKKDKKEEKKEEPKKDEAKKEEPKKDEPKKEEAKKDEPKREEPKKEEPKKEEPKKESRNQSQQEPQQKDQQKEPTKEQPRQDAKQDSPKQDNKSPGSAAGNSASTGDGGRPNSAGPASGPDSNGGNRSPAATSGGSSPSATGPNPGGKSGPPLAGPGPGSMGPPMPAGSMISSTDLGPSLSNTVRIGPAVAQPILPPPVIIPPPVVNAVPSTVRSDIIKDTIRNTKTRTIIIINKQ